MNVTFILLGIIGVVYGTLLVGIEFRKWRARIHCRVPVDAVFEKTVTKKMGDRVRTYALFSYYYQEKKFRQCTMERITRKEKNRWKKEKFIRSGLMRRIQKTVLSAEKFSDGRSADLYFRHGVLAEWYFLSDR